MKTSRSLIFALAKELHVQRAPRSKKHRRHYDNGMPIDLRYDSGYYTAAPAPKAQTESLSVPGRDFLSSPFANTAPGVVESFENEDEQEDSGSVPDWGSGQMDEMEEQQEDQQQQAQANLQQAVQAVTAKSLSAPAPNRQSGLPAPPALPNSTPTDDADTRAFQSDLAAILQGKKTHPSIPTPHLQDSQETHEEPEEAPQPPPQAPAQAAAMSHDIFEKMGHPMSAAQTFNLGSFALDRQLDSFDREIERKARSKTPPQPAVKPRPAPVARAASAVNIRYDVPLVPQQTGMSCWAAGCAMIVGWRDQMSVDPAEIARAAGAWAQYRTGLEPENASIFPIWGMAPEPAQSYTVEAFCQLLERFGPLWAASAEPGAHIRVVTGASGDGTPDGTTLYINDPWENGMASFRLPNAGSQTAETYAAFVQKQESLARRESNVQGIYIAHNLQPRA